MRRLAVVAGRPADRPAGDSDDTRTWLDRLPTVGVTWYDHLAGVPLERMDVLWLRGEPDPDPRLPEWLGSGGRMLATQDGVVVSNGLGLAAHAHATARPFDDTPADFGLAGFGAHPLFTGLRDGALASPAPPGTAGRIWCYDQAWPVGAGVVAVERRGLDLRAETALAWEYAVGDGGLLCIGFEPGWRRGDGSIVLANALAGDAIPHRERAPRAPLWPRPGRRACAGSAERVGARPPWLVAPADAWPRSTSTAFDLAPAAEWTHAGRRLLVTARPGTPGRDVWAPPFRIMHAAAVRDAIPCAPAHLASDEVAGGLALASHRLLERWVAAPDVPAVVWEIAGYDGIGIAVEWSVDFRRAWPHPDGTYGDLWFDVAGDRRSLYVEAEGGPRATYALSGGTLTVEGSDTGAVLRVRCVGTTPLRVVVAAGIDAAELARSVSVMGRGVHELAAARERKAAQLERHGTAFEAPDEVLALGFAWAHRRGDESLIGVPGLGRSMLTGCPRGAGQDAWCFGAQACAAAAAQLVAGLREPAREVLKFLAQAQHPDGGIAAWYPIGGLATAPDAASTVAFLGLAERLFAWTGETEALVRLRPALESALAYLASHPSLDAVPSARVLDAMDPLAAGAAATLAGLRARCAAAPSVMEPPAVEPHAVVEAAAAALRRSPGALPGTEAAPALLEAVAALWGLEPNAPEAALTVAPLLPTGWDRFALRGLRLGRSVLDLELRRRAGTVVVRSSLRFGPRLVLTVGVRGVEVVATDADDIGVAGPRARFEAHARHEVRFHLAG